MDRLGETVSRDARLMSGILTSLCIPELFAVYLVFTNEC